MSIVKVQKRENPYILIDKAGVQDINLSWKATGLLTYLIGRPEDWKIVLEHLATCKTDGMTSCKSALKELRQHNYCHFFELRKSGRIVETFYMVYEVPTPYTEELHQEILSSIDNLDDSYTLFYKKAEDSKIEIPTTIKTIENKKSVEKTSVLPKVGNQLVVNTLSANHRLLNKDNTKERVTNNRTTTNESKKHTEVKEKNDSSSYDFLSLKKYSLLNTPTINNIQNNLKNLTEEKFEEIYNLTLEYVNSGKGKDFNAILYKGLKGEWNFTPLERQKAEENVENTEDLILKRKWLSRYVGLSKELKEEIMNIIKEIPLDILNKKRSKLSQMTPFEMKQALLSLKNNPVVKEPVKVENIKIEKPSENKNKDYLENKTLEQFEKLNTEEKIRVEEKAVSLLCEKEKIDRSFIVNIKKVAPHLYMGMIGNYMYQFIPA